MSSTRTAKPDEIRYTVTSDTLIAHLPKGENVEVPTELTFDETMALGAIALAMEAGTASEAEIFQHLADGLVPPRMREKIGPLPLRTALKIFKRWLVEALKALEVLGEDEASS